MEQFINSIKERTQRNISESAESLIDNILSEIQEMRESFVSDIRNGDLPLETYDLDDRCRELTKKEELAYFVLDKVSHMREDIIEVLLEKEKPIETIYEFVENNNYISELQADEYDLAVMKATEKYKEFDFEKE